MRYVQVQGPSFPTALLHAALQFQPSRQWQVLCGDQDHWRVGLFSPAETAAAELVELEQHTCPELFCLLQGRLTLLLFLDGELAEVALVPGEPLLITAPHGGFCPDGPHTGSALVVERDLFSTEYRTIPEWQQKLG